MDAFDLAGCCHRIFSQGLVEPHDVPPLFAARAVASLIPTLLDRAAVPTSVAGFDSKPDVGPSNVNVDDPAAGERDRVLPLGIGQPHGLEALDQQLLETTLGRPRLSEHALEPPLEHGDAVFAAAAMSFEVGRRTVGRDQAEIPGVLGGPSETKRVERGSQAEQHAHWRGHDQAVVSSQAVGVVEPR